MSWRDLSTLRRLLPASLAGLVCSLALLVGASSASAAPSPWWRLSSRPAPTYLPPEAKEAKIFAAATNLGDLKTSGQVTLSDTLPPNVEATSASVRTEFSPAGGVCQEPTLPPGTKHLSCELPEPVLPYERLEYRITVKLLPGAKTGEANTVNVV